MLYIHREQEAGDCFYVIESGTFAASVQGKKVFVYEEKGAFGELALMYNCPRAATVQVCTLRAITEPCNLDPRLKNLLVFGLSLVWSML